MWSRPKQLITAPARNEYAAGKWCGPLHAIERAFILYSLPYLSEELRRLKWLAVSQIANDTMAAPRKCTNCKITKLCDGYDHCVWPVYAAGIKEADRTVRAKPPRATLRSKKCTCKDGVMCDYCYNKLSPGELSDLDA